MKLIQIAIILSGLSQAYPQYSYVPIYSSQCECKGYNKNSRSIIVKDTMWVLNITSFVFIILRCSTQETFIRKHELSQAHLQIVLATSETGLVQASCLYVSC